MSGTDLPLLEPRGAKPVAEFLVKPFEDGELNVQSQYVRQFERPDRLVVAQAARS